MSVNLLNPVYVLIDTCKNRRTYTKLTSCKRKVRKAHARMRPYSFVILMTLFPFSFFAALLSQTLFMSVDKPNQIISRNKDIPGETPVLMAIVSASKRFGTI